ncbi:MAG: phosphopantetheine adenylyltransferase [Thermoplasmatota archaeon]
MPKKVILGGTFDHVHMGHVKLIERAFEEGDVTIGLVSDEMLKEWKPEVEKSYKERKKNLDTFLAGKENWEIVKISDPYSKAIEGDFDILVVSSETKERGEKINRKRKKIGEQPLKIIEVKPVVAEDFLPISSTRIRNGEIDEYGDRLIPVKIILECTVTEEFYAVKELMSDFFECEISRSRVNFNDDDLEVPDGIDYVINLAIESENLECERLFVEKAVIKDKLGFTSNGRSPGLKIPNKWVQSNNKLDLCKSLKIVGDELEKNFDPVGMVTGEATDIKGYIKSALIDALLPRMKGELYG